MNECDLALLDKFVALVDEKNFVSFNELSKVLGLSTSELVALKTRFEEYLRDHRGEDFRLVSDIDTDLPGFFIES